MQCPHCGADVLAGNTFCQRCRKRVIPPSTTNSSPRPEMRQTPVSRPAPVAGSTAEEGAVYTPPAHAPQVFTRPGWVTMLAILYLLGGLLLLLATVGLGLASRTSPTSSVAMLAIAAVLLVATLLYLTTGVGLWRLRSWGRNLAIVFAILGLLQIPLGTIICILLLVYLFRPGTRIMFSGCDPSRLSRSEWELVEAASKGGVLLTVIVTLLILVSVLFAAAIAIPSFLRARTAANESAAIGQLRVIISAEAEYATLNGGLYDDIDCLMAPAKCIPGASSAPPLLDPVAFSEKTLQGYRFVFFAGDKPLPGTVDPSKVSASSVRSFAVIAEPLALGRTGSRIFCGTAAGTICQVDSVDPQRLLHGCQEICVRDAE